MKKRKNYYQVHLNKRPKGKLHPKRNLIRMIQFCTEIVLSTVKTVKAIREFQEAISKLAVPCDVTNSELKALKYHLMMKSRSDSGGNYPSTLIQMTPKYKNGIYEYAIKKMVKKSPSKFEIEIIEKNAVAPTKKITGQHAHLLPVWNPDLYPMPTDSDAVQAIKTSLNNLGFKNDI